jgi:hypothetical protein
MAIDAQICDDSARGACRLLENMMKARRQSETDD